VRRKTRSGGPGRPLVRSALQILDDDARTARKQRCQ
jgi:hypothetical protein